MQYLALTTHDILLYTLDNNIIELMSRGVGSTEIVRGRTGILTNYDVVPMLLVTFKEGLYAENFGILGALRCILSHSGTPKLYS